MRIAVTGTPGTGKTTATAAVSEHQSVPVVHLNEAIRTHGLWTERDADRDSLVVDLDAVREHLGDWDGLVESHLAHYLEADRVVVLRCRPDQLRERLLDRGESEQSATENAESEALDVILSEAVERHGAGCVYEVETTNRSPEAVADVISAVVRGEAEPSVGQVDYTEYLTV